MSTRKYTPPWHTYLFSYLWDQVLEVSGSPINEHLEVILSRGRLKLNSRNATYSYEDLYSNFYRTFNRLKFKDKTLNEVLILGFGLGSIMVMLEKYFQQSAAYIGVELDDEVIHLCTKYLEEKMLEKVELFQEDAFTFLETYPPKQFDLITVDVFIDTVTPIKFRSARFLQLLDQRLVNDGYLVYNVLVNNDTDEKVIQKFFRQKFKRVFPQADIIKLYGNWMLVVKNS